MVEWLKGKAYSSEYKIIPVRLGEVFDDSEEEAYDTYTAIDYDGELSVVVKGDHPLPDHILLVKNYDCMAEDHGHICNLVQDHSYFQHRCKCGYVWGGRSDGQ